MTLKISHHKLEGVDYIASPNVSGVITPRFVVQHYTAGYTARSAIETFKRSSSKVSAHLIIDLDGTITQMVPFNRRAWHAGPSSFQGFRDLNSHSIGIEYVNIGYLRKTSKGFLDPYGKTVDPAQFPDLVEEAEPRIGSGVYYWPTYTEAQIKAGLEASQAIVEKYGIKAFVDHETIDTRGWKTDTGPAFPMKQFQALITGGRQSPEDSGDDIFVVNTPSLNVRGGAGVEWPVIGKLTTGDEIKEIDRVGSWAFVNFKPGEEGWVHTNYIRAK